MSEFKPGDVAMVQCWDGKWRRAFLQASLYGVCEEARWIFPDGRFRLSSESLARPLVTIDPEDSLSFAVEAAQRACSALNVMPGRVITPAIEAVQDVLREFAHPTVRIVEPTLVGAVVEDHRGLLWVRVADADTDPGGDWQQRTQLSPPWRRPGVSAKWWDHLEAVRILSPGYTPEETP